MVRPCLLTEGGWGEVRRCLVEVALSAAPESFLFAFFNIWKIFKIFNILIIKIFFSIYLAALGFNCGT